MSTIIRPHTLLRISGPHPFMTTLRIASQRQLTYSAPRLAPIPGVRHNSTALDKEVKEQEEHSRSDSTVVGGIGKGAEGVHFQG
jgi:hypothetical protein